MREGIRDTRLELVRNGPEHNQLLSPLTPYIALCGPWPPRTITMPFEHRELITRLARLRYVTGGSAVSAEQSDAELCSIGAAVGRVLGEVPGLQAALSDVSRDGAHLVHLRLSLNALELAMIPFETAVAPDNLPGSGAALLLRTPTVITREIRRSQPIDVRWNREYRILFAFATQPGSPPVPAQAHLEALRRVIDPYVPIVDDRADKYERVRNVQAQLTVLPEASLKEIGDACRALDYTHVHILAHGAALGDGTTRRYGVVLRDDQSPTGYKVVDGETLAIALRGADSSTVANKPLPTLVSLATCDSGAVDSVVVPGGSIAHELHRVGVPWVIASQFPLWMRASTILVEALYRGILSGDDPRVVLYQVRQRLRLEVPETHDWASIVAYAVPPWMFEKQVEPFFDKQVKRRLNVKFARIDTLTTKSAASSEDAAEIKSLGAAVRKEHAAWLTRPSVGVSGSRRAEVLGMSAASEKRIAIALAQLARVTENEKAKTDYEQGSGEAYRTARQAYRQAIESDPTNHWVITQFVSIAAVPSLMSTSTAEDLVRTRYGPWWNASRQIARWQVNAHARLDQAWAHGTLAELELLGSVYEGPGHDAVAARQRITESCCEIVRLIGPDSFAVNSTRRQFTRYINDWAHPRWTGHAQAALEALNEDI